jgi:hypothetical protein
MSDDYANMLTKVVREKHNDEYRHDVMQNKLAASCKTAMLLK